MDENVTQKIMVSVMCVAYNQEKYIAHTLDSILAQKTDFDYEIIVHDDASTDNTAQIILEYAKKFPGIIRTIIQKENQYSKLKALPLNVPRKNIGEMYMFSLAKGKYYAHCEGDDYWCDNMKLQKQVDLLEQHPECGICVHKVQYVHEDETIMDQTLPRNEIETDNYFISQRRMEKILLQDVSYPFHTSSYVVRADISKQYSEDGTPFSYGVNGDMKILRLALKYGGFIYIPEIMSCRRMGASDGYSARRKKRNDEEKISNLKMNMFCEDKYDEYTGYQFHDSIEIGQMRRVVRYARTEDYKEARKILLERNMKLKASYKYANANIGLRFAYIALKYAPFLFCTLTKKK